MGTDGHEQEQPDMDLNPTVELTLYGEVPVQADGTVDGVPFYFRSRGNRWSIEVGARDGGDVEFRYEEPYGDAPFEAGWIRHPQALALLARGLAVWQAWERATRPGAVDKGLESLPAE